jgi:hypothetical protein
VFGIPLAEALSVPAPRTGRFDGLAELAVGDLFPLSAPGLERLTDSLGLAEVPRPEVATLFQEADDCVLLIPVRLGRLQTSPGRAPLWSWTRTIPATSGRRNGRTASTWQMSTGRTGSASLAAVRPTRRPSRVISCWYTPGGTSFFDTAHLNSRLMRSTSLLIRPRQKPSRIISSRMASRRRAAKSPAADVP